MSIEAFARDVAAVEAEQWTSPAPDPAGRLARLSARLRSLLDAAEDKGAQSVIYWHGRWLSYTEAQAALAVVEGFTVPPGEPEREG